MRMGRPLLVGVAFLAFIWRRGFTFLNPLPRPFTFNFLVDLVDIILMLLSVGTSPPRRRSGRNHKWCGCRR